MLLIRELTAKRKGRSICDELQRRGHEVVGMQVQDDGHTIMVALDILKGDEPWWKAIQLPVHSADPGRFERAFDDWRAKVRADLFEGHPTPVVKRAIQQHGRAAVDAALKPRLGALA